MKHFHPYEGDMPYVFISYAHADSAQVMEVLENMQARSCRIWYDEGIEVGSEWPECIAGHLAGAGLMIAFISNAYMRSDNCRREMHFALSKKIKIINVFLEDTRMTPGMEMQIGNIFALMKQNMGEEEFFRKLYAAPALSPELFAAPDGAEKRLPEKKKRAPKPPRAKKPRTLLRRLLCLLLALLLTGGLLALGIVAYSTGLGRRLIISMQLQQPEPLSGGVEAVFAEPVFESIAREYSGIGQGGVYVSDLAGLHELYISGGSWSFDEPREQTPFSAGEKGEIRSLDDLKYFTGLEKLVLVNQPLSSLEPLPACTIEYLDVSGCEISSLQGVGRLVNLRELSAEGCPIRELGDIDHCLKLRSLNIGSSSLSDFSALKPLTSLNEFSVSNCALDELDTVVGLSSLKQLGFYDCDLRGRFFKGFDRERHIVSLTLANCQLNSTINIEDFTGLTTLTLISTGEELDWSGLAGLPALSKVYYDRSMEAALTRALGGSRSVQLIPMD